MQAKIMTHLITYYPGKEESLKVAKALIDGGTSYLEFQFPFSDPTADGVYIQRACQRAIDNGFSVKEGFCQLAAIKKLAGSIPVFVMSYGNLVFKRGVKAFLQECRNAGAEGVIIPDFPPDYDEGLYKTATDLGLAAIPVIAPTISDERLKLAADTGSPYIYASLRKGITGTKTDISEENIRFLNRIKPYGVKVLGGFGITEKSQVELLAPYVHAAVVGSAFIKAIMEYGEDKNPYEPVLQLMKKLV
jgi:tryptophan synthase alpha chain